MHVWGTPCPIDAGASNLETAKKWQ
jgi:hypothetical protein